MNIVKSTFQQMNVAQKATTISITLLVASLIVGFGWGALAAMVALVVLSFLYLSYWAGVGAVKGADMVADAIVEARRVPVPVRVTRR